MPSKQKRDNTLSTKSATIQDVKGYDNKSNESWKKRDSSKERAETCTYKELPNDWQRRRGGGFGWRKWENGEINSCCALAAAALPVVIAQPIGRRTDGALCQCVSLFFYLNILFFFCSVSYSLRFGWRRVVEKN